MHLEASYCLCYFNKYSNYLVCLEFSSFNTQNLVSLRLFVTKLGAYHWNGYSNAPQIENILLTLIIFHTGGVTSMSVMVLQMITTVL